MPKVHDELSPPQERDPKWFVKVNDELVYGPVSLATLYEWAAKGDILPAKEVSSDRQHWVQAQSLPDLKMEWVVHRPDGESLGPFNLLALPHLVSRGAVEADATVRHVTDGKLLPVQSLLKPTVPPHQDMTGPAGPLPPQQKPVSAAAHQALATSDEAGKRRAQVEAREREVAGRIAALERAALAREEALSRTEAEGRLQKQQAAAREQGLKQQLQKLKQASEAARKEADDDARQHAQEKAGHAESDARSRQTEKELKKAASDLRRQVSGAKRRLATQRAKMAELKETCRGLKKETSENGKELRRALSRQRELEEERADWERLGKEAEAREQALHQRLRHLEENVDFSTELLETAQAELRRQAESGPAGPLTHERKAVLGRRLEQLRRHAEVCVTEIQELRQRTAAREASYTQKEADHVKRQFELAKRVAALKKEAKASGRTLAATERRLATREQEYGRLVTHREKRKTDLKVILATLSTAIRAAAAGADSLHTELEALLRAQALPGEGEQGRQEASPAADERDSRTDGGWYLQLDSGSVYGPVPLAQLTDWAADYRVGPEHRVSEGKKRWRRARDVPELGMVWMIKLANGKSYGPLSASAIGQLIRDGSADMDARLVNTETGKTLPARQLLDSGGEGRRVVHGRHASRFTPRS